MAVSALEPKLVSTLEHVVDVLHQVAAFEIDTETAERMRALGEKKEACTAEEREEHRRWADLWQRGTLHKLQAINALRELHEQMPDLVKSLPTGPGAA